MSTWLWTFDRCLSMCCWCVDGMDSLWRCSPVLSPAGLIQLFCMSTCLWTFGRYLERVLLVPVLAVPAVYMVSGIAGGLASANLAVDRVTVTSTAAIAGLVGGSPAQNSHFVLVSWLLHLGCCIKLGACLGCACCAHGQRHCWGAGFCQLGC